MDINNKKLLTLFKLWCHTNFPEKDIPTLVEQFEEEYVEFKASVDEFVELVFAKLNSIENI